MVLSFLFMFFFINAYTIRDNIPKVSIITSMYNGDLYIEEFMQNITSQTIFDECELIIINANSPGNEEVIINKYLERYPNIKYIKLNERVSIYCAWNIAIKNSSSNFLTNANLDDLRTFDSIESQYNFLINNDNIDLVYGDCLVSFQPNGKIEEHLSKFYKYGHIYFPQSLSKDELKVSILYSPENYLENLKFNLPGPMPMWRKRIHDNFGLFDENFIVAGDWEMWLRAISNNCKFAKINKFIGMYYYNLISGLSTIREGSIREKGLIERSLIRNMYKELLSK